MWEESISGKRANKLGELFIRHNIVDSCISIEPEFGCDGLIGCCVSVEGDDHEGSLVDWWIRFNEEDTPFSPYTFESDGPLYIPRLVWIFELAKEAMKV